MNRRDAIKMAALGIGLAAWPSLVHAADAGRIVIYDSRFPESTTFAASFASKVDCRNDAAALWFNQLARPRFARGEIAGCTTAADAMILADCARREGRVFSRVGDVAGNRQLTIWRISGPAPAAPGKSA